MIARNPMPETARPSRDHLVGGVTCGWNAYQETGALVVSRAAGPRLWDVDGREYLDWNMGWGSLLLGHTPEVIHEALRESMQLGFGFQYETEHGALLATELCRATGTDAVRFASTGAEVTMHAMRVARRATGRVTIVKFEGHFHGIQDFLLYGVDAGKKVGERRPDGTIPAIPGSSGMPDAMLEKDLRILPFNDLEALEQLFGREGDRIAGVILEPMAMNMGFIRPDTGYLEGLRALCTKHGCVLIFDEIRTGFRVARGGAIEATGVMPDLVCYGKALGCGMPVAALAGKKSFMDLISPTGDVEVSGTNTGRNFTVLGTLAALRALGAPGFYAELDRLTQRFVQGARRVLSDRSVPGYVEGQGGTIGLYLGIPERPRDFRQVITGLNRPYQVKCYRAAHYEHGLYGFLLPQADCPEALVMSILHTDDVLDETLNRFDDILKATPYSAKP